MSASQLMDFYMWLQDETICVIGPRTAGQPATVVAKAGTANNIAHVCTIQVSFQTGFGNAALVTNTTVNVVLMNTLVLQPQSYDVTSAQGTLSLVAASPPLYTTLQPIACNTSDYEQVALLAAALCCVCWCNSA